MQAKGRERDASVQRWGKSAGGLSPLIIQTREENTAAQPRGISVCGLCTSAPRKQVCFSISRGNGNFGKGVTWQATSEKRRNEDDSDGLWCAIDAEAVSEPTGCGCLSVQYSVCGAADMSQDV